MAEFKTLKLAEEYYKLGKRTALPSVLRDQFLRSASSVALNLAEGNAKSSQKDRLRIFEIARGSFLESTTILRLLEVRDKDLMSVADKLGAHLYRLNFRLKKQLESGECK